MYKILIPIQGDFVAPRFDCTTELIIALIKDGVLLEKPKTIIMERCSEEALCQIITDENIDEVVCGGIDKVHYDFLIWKKISIIDGVIGGWTEVLEKAIHNDIRPSAIVSKKAYENLRL